MSLISEEEDKEELEEELRKKKSNNWKVSTKFQINPSTHG